MPAVGPHAADPTALLLAGAVRELERGLNAVVPQALPHGLDVAAAVR